MSEKYKPIDCSIYDELEVLAMKKVLCTIEFSVDETTQSVQSRIADVFAKNGEEFVRLDDGQLIRLDHLHRINDRSISGYHRTPK